MNSSSPPPSDQHTTVFEAPQSTLVDIFPTSSSSDTPQKRQLRTVYRRTFLSLRKQQIHASGNPVKMHLLLMFLVPGLFLLQTHMLLPLNWIVCGS